MRPILLAMLPAVVVASCSDSLLPTSPEVTAGGLTYRGNVEVVEPESLHTALTIANGTDELQSVVIGGCLFLRRAYRDGERVWDEADVVGCPAVIRRIQVAPGEEQKFESTIEMGFFLENGLSEGRYTMSIYIRPEDGEEIELNAGDVELHR